MTDDFAFVETLLEPLERNVSRLVQRMNSLIFAASINTGHQEYQQGYADRVEYSLLYRQRNKVRALYVQYTCPLPEYPCRKYRLFEWPA